jgi:hypothetical protein
VSDAPQTGAPAEDTEASATQSGAAGVPQADAAPTSAPEAGGQVAGVSDVEVRPPGEQVTEAQPAVEAQAGGALAGGAPPSGGARHSHRSGARGGGGLGRLWKPALALVVILAVAFSVGKSVLPVFGVSGDKGTSETTQQSDAPPIANVNGVQVPGTGQPMLMLNPGLVRPGGVVQVLGSGFDAGSKVDIRLAANKKDKGKPVGTVTANKVGNVTAEVSFPMQAGGGGNSLIVAQQRNSTHTATAQAVVAQGVGAASLSAMVGKPGDTVALTARGFAPGETLSVYWGRTAGKPNMTLQADTSGTVLRQPLRVGVAPVGTSSLFVVGQKSGIAAGVPFQVLTLYPSAGIKPYALRSQQSVSFNGKGFAPGERVLVYLNSQAGQPLMVIQTSENGTFSGGGFKVPYELKGAQSLMFVGEQSRATAKTGFTVMPYIPSGRPSVYSALPGTALSFYAQGFAPNEAVHVYTAKTKDSPGTLVAAFRVDGAGRATAAGTYTVPGDSDGVMFKLVGQRSGATAVSTVKIDHSGGPVQIPPAPPYHLPKNLEK